LPAAGRSGAGKRGRFLFVCKQDSHKTLYEFLQGGELEQRTVTERKPGKRTVTYRYRWLEAVPLRDGKDALKVNWIGLTLTDASGKTTYNNAFVTSLQVTGDTVAEIAACAAPAGRSRAKASMS